jgi:hypothetical protein
MRGGYRYKEAKLATSNGFKPKEAKVAKGRRLLVKSSGFAYFASISSNLSAPLSVRILFCREAYSNHEWTRIDANRLVSPKRSDGGSPNSCSFAV